MRRVAWIVPLIGMLLVASVPLVRYAQKNAAEDAAAEFLARVHEAQRAFRSTHGGYASDAVSLTSGCSGESAPLLPPGALGQLALSRYDWTLRPANRAESRGVDCHGRGTVSDFYASVRPMSPASPGKRAYAVTSRGRIYLFYDGVPPAERDMQPGGLATALDAAAAFRIP